jgi:hypothetical protein
MSDLRDPPDPPAPADILSALGPDYQAALAEAIAVRIDELARERELVRNPVPEEQLAVPRRQRVRPRVVRSRTLALLAAVPIAVGTLLFVGHATMPMPMHTGTAAQLQPMSAAQKEQVLAYQSCMVHHGFQISLSPGPGSGFRTTGGAVGKPLFEAANTPGFKAANAACDPPNGAVRVWPIPKKG